MTAGDLRDVLRAETRAPESLAALRGALTGGRLCVIRDAIDPELAEEMSRCVASATDWEAIAVFEQPYSAYINQQIREPTRYPEPLQRFKALLESEASRSWIADLTGADCIGEVRLHASRHLPGGYSLPHNDFGGGETVSFTWFLQKSWEARWGGHFFWCSPPTFVVPSFNTLVLFRVTRESFHFVCPVSPAAQHERLAITAWWTGAPAPPIPFVPAASWYKGSLEEIGAGIFVTPAR